MDSALRRVEGALAEKNEAHEMLKDAMRVLKFVAFRYYEFILNLLKYTFKT